MTVNADAPSAMAYCAPMNVDAPFSAEYCTSANVDAPFLGEYCTSANVDAPFPREYCTSANVGASFPEEYRASANVDAQFTAECCASVNIDTPFAIECCTFTNFDVSFPAECCMPTNTDVPFPALCCTPTSAGALFPFSNGVAQCFEGDAETFGGALQTSVGIPPVALGNFIETSGADVVAIGILHLFGHHEAFRGFLFLDLDAFLVVLEKCLLGIPLLLGLQYTPMQDDVIQPYARQHVDRVPQLPLIDVEQQGNVLRTMGVGATDSVENLRIGKDEMSEECEKLRFFGGKIWWGGKFLLSLRRKIR